MKSLVLVLALLISACTTVPVTVKFPQPPGNVALEPCANLEMLTHPTQLSTVAATVFENYFEYHKCAAKQSAWIDWYQQQRKLFESIQ